MGGLICKPLSSPTHPLEVLLTAISKTKALHQAPPSSIPGPFLFLNFHRKECPGIEFTQPHPQALKIGPGTVRLGLSLTVWGTSGDKFDLYQGFLRFQQFDENGENGAQNNGFEIVVE